MMHRHPAECEQQAALPFDRQCLPNRAGGTFDHRAIQASAPRRTMPATQAAGICRVVSTLQRCFVWDIDLAFKRLKSLLHIDRLPTRTEPTSRSWLYAHLILAPLCDDLSQDFLDSPPEELSDAAYIPSLWTVHKMALLILLSIVLGPFSLVDFIAAGPTVHRQLANAPRRRKPHVRYPARGLF